MASSSYQTHYERLGITQQAQLKEIREAYRKLALKCHPDKDPHNPRAVATFQKLSTAYETLSDENRRTKYDATLPWSQTLRQPPQPANWPYQGSYDYVWSKLARERADRARREDPDYWSGPTYAHGATYCSGSSKQWDEEQKDAFDKYERRQQERAARREARKEAESKERDMNRPPPSQEPFDQGSETFKARPGKSRKKEEARAKTEGEAREDDDNWGNPPSPPKPHSDRWYKTEKETKEEYQKRSDKESRRADRRKAKREQSEKQWSTELMILLSKIVSTEVDIEDTEAKVNEAKRATNGEREDDDHEQIFHLQIRRKSLERRLQERIDEYKLIVKYLRDQGWEHEADEANVKLREARKEVTGDRRAGRQGSSQGKQAESTTKTTRKGQAEKARGKSPADNERPDPQITTTQPSQSTKAQRSNTEPPSTTTLPLHDRQDFRGATQQQQASRDYVSNPKVSYDGSDPDQGFTENTPESSIAGDDYDYDDEDYDPPFCNDFHDSHLEVHREFWDIVDDWHECNFCHRAGKSEYVRLELSISKTSSTLRIEFADLTMGSYDLLIINGLVVTASDVGPYDIAIKDEKIALLAPRGSLAEIAAKRVIDAEGGYVMPGGVDAHVHLDEPPLFGKGKSADNYETGLKVTFAPQSKSDPSLLSVLQQTHAKAHRNCYTDYSFHLLISNPTPDVLSEFPALREQGISSLKIYMTYEALQLRDNQILDVLLEARKNAITTLIHSENGDILSWMTEQLEMRGLYAPKYHATSRPQIVETEATNRAIVLATIIDTPILIVHVSSASAAAHIRHAQTKGMPIYAETCPQYLFLTRSDLDLPGFEGAKCVCSPPPREGPEDHEAIWRGLFNGTFTVLSSDHCPFVYDDKEAGKKSVLSKEYPEGRFRYIPNGCPGVETRLPLVFCEGEKRLGLSKFVEVTCSNAAKLYGLYPKKGALLPGLSDADLCIWYPKNTLEPIRVRNGQLHHNVDYTPYEGREVGNWPRWTILRGKVVWARDEGGVVGEKGFGKFVARGASWMAGSGEKGDWDVEDL